MSHNNNVGRGVGRFIGHGFVIARDAVARGLIAFGATPNTLTVAGLLATCGAAVCFFLGGGYSCETARASGTPPYFLYAGGFLILACACDMLDGAVARLGNLRTPFGAVLDSSLDRISDLVVYVGLIGHFMLRQNLTYTILAAVALGNAFLVSYIKARSENVIPDCSVGFWKRPERCVALLVAAFAGTVPGMLWQQAVSPAFTVVRRLRWTHRVLAAQAAGRPPPPAQPPPGWKGLLRPWRWPRRSLSHDVTCLTNILFIIFAHHLSPLFGPDADPFKQLWFAWRDRVV